MGFQKLEPRNFIVWLGISWVLSTMCFLFFLLISGNYCCNFPFSTHHFTQCVCAKTRYFVFSLSISSGHWDPIWTWWGEPVHQQETLKSKLNEFKEWKDGLLPLERVWMCPMWEKKSAQFGDRDTENDRELIDVCQNLLIPSSIMIALVHSMTGKLETRFPSLFLTKCSYVAKIL